MGSSGRSAADEGSLIMDRIRRISRIDRIDRRTFVNAVVIAVAAQAIPAPAFPTPAFPTLDEEGLHRMRPYSADGPLVDWHVDDMWGSERIRPARFEA